MNYGMFCLFAFFNSMISIIRNHTVGWGKGVNLSPCFFFSPFFSNLQTSYFSGSAHHTSEVIGHLLCHPQPYCAYALSNRTLYIEKLPLWYIITCANKSPQCHKNSFVPWWRRLLTAKKGNTSPHVHLKRNFTYFVFPFHLTALQSGKLSRIGSA